MTADEIGDMSDDFETYISYIGKSLYFMNEEKTIIAAEADKHYGFSATFFLSDRMYCFYRDGESHNTYDGVAMYSYSDDDGETWSVPATLYDGSVRVSPADLVNDPWPLPM
jgi:Neuraminidase (sialidase)